MRRGNEPKLIIEGSKFIGVNLSSDFTAEHEWGIDPLKNALGIPLDNTVEENFGIKGRTITVFEKGLFFFEKKETHTCLLFDTYGDGKNWRWWAGELMPEPEVISAAWSESDFGVVVANILPNNTRDVLLELYEAFQKKDVTIMLGGGGVLENAGLMLLIASRVPQNVDERLRKRDDSHFRLTKAMEETNIRQILKAAGKQYFALSPKWKDDEEREIIYWLNPYRQGVDNYGWFTLQDLLDWVENKGPIPMKKG